jgi:toxin ParE1/3/4
MLEVEVTRRAKLDLAEIWEYIAANNLTAADRVVQRFGDAFGRIAHMPSLGESYSGSLPGTRFLTSGAYVIVYILQHDRIQISRVLHSARDWQTMLDTMEDLGLD